MASVNRATILGNAARDPEVKYTPSGSAVCSMSIATNRSWKDKTTGEKQEESEFHRVVFYDKLAEIVGQYVTKGKSLYVEGRLKTRKWQDKEGRDVYTTEIVADQMQLLGSRGDGEQSSPAQRQSAPQQRQAPQRQAGPKSNTGFDDMSDEIPF